MPSSAEKLLHEYYDMLKDGLKTDDGQSLVVLDHNDESIDPEIIEDINNAVYKTGKVKNPHGYNDETGGLVFEPKIAREEDYEGVDGKKEDILFSQSLVVKMVMESGQTIFNV